jgi:ribonuclease G
VEDERVVEFHYEPEGGANPEGNIYLGRITHVAKGLGAAFVDIGMKEAAFLPLSDVPGPVVEGAKQIVQIERWGRAEKGPRITTRVNLTGAYLVLQPGRRGVSVSERIVDKSERSRLAALVRAIAQPGEGLAVRTAAGGEEERRLREEAAALRMSWQELSSLFHAQPPALLYRQPPGDLRLLRDHGHQFSQICYDQRGAAEAAAAWCKAALPGMDNRIAFRRSADWIPAPDQILEQIEDALAPSVDLAEGGGLIIEPTEAMTVIDVNAQAASAAQPVAGGERVLLRTNLAAADEIARQIRLRNIGGIVVVDFIDLKDAAHRRQVVDRLRAATVGDSAPVWIGAMSRLGLVELTRKRRGPTLAQIMTETCATCEGTGRARRPMDKL